MKKVISIIIIIIILFVFIGIMYLIPNQAIKVIYKALLNEKSEYSLIKNKNKDIYYQEYAVHNKIVIKEDSGKEERDYSFITEGDYITYKGVNNDNRGLTYFKYIIEAICLNNGMDKKLVNIYIDNLIDEGKSSKYFKIIKDNDNITYKYYYKERFDIPKINIYIMEGDILKYLDKIEEGIFVEKGKIGLHVKKDVFGTITIIVSEYMGHTDLMYKSIINTVKDIKPVNYERFLEDFDSLRQINRKSRTYTADVLNPDIAKNELDYYEKGNYYMKIVFRNE